MNELEQTIQEEERRRAVVIFSGGMDSTTVLYRALEENDEVAAISFNYGQRHSRELEVAQVTANKLGIEHKIVDLRVLKPLMGGSALTDKIAVPHGHFEDESMKQTVVPNRNMIFLSIAAAYAISSNAQSIYTGVHAGDHAIYPDCRPEFIDAMRDALRVANYDPIEVRTPYIDTTKEGILKDGFRLGVDYSLTHTCYEGTVLACGGCGSCQERLEAFENTGKKDPLSYA